MENVITLDASNTGSFFGPLAGPYAYRPELRSRLDEVFAAAMRSTNRYFVLEGSVVRAAQLNRDGALAYMQDGFVLVEVDLPFCGRMVHVEGTNGGRMPCGAKFNGDVYLCGDCE